MSVGITSEEYELEREQFHHALECIELLARELSGEGWLNYSGDLTLRQYADLHWRDEVPDVYRYLVEDEQ